jgi:hypothetical protein
MCDTRWTNGYRKKEIGGVVITTRKDQDLPQHRSSWVHETTRATGHQGSPFMPRCATTEDENATPPLGRGKDRQVLGWVVVNDNEAHPGAPRHPSKGADFQRT